MPYSAWQYFRSLNLPIPKLPYLLLISIKLVFVFFEGKVIVNSACVPYSKVLPSLLKEYDNLDWMIITVFLYMEGSSVITL